MPVVWLDTADDARLNLFCRLTDRELRSSIENERGILIAESRIVVEVALEVGLSPVSFLVEEGYLTTCADILTRCNETTAFVLPTDEMERLIGYRLMRGIIGAFGRPAQTSVDELLSQEHKRLVLVEDIVDTTNLGALFRSSAALGADGIILSPRCPDPLCRRSLRVSMGNILRIPWARADRDAWPRRTISDLREQGFDVSALALTPDAIPLDEVNLKQKDKRALVFGNEGTGLCPETVSFSERAIVIPMTNGVDSLNVAASSAVALWHLFR